MINAIILAGGDSRGLLQEGDPSQPKSLLPLKGKAMLDYVLEALGNCSAIGKKVAVGPRIVEEKMGDKVDFFVEGGNNIFNNVALGLQVLPPDQPVLVVTSDIPLLTKEALEDFLYRCQGKEAELYYPIIRKEDNEKKYPDNKRTYVRLREGTFTGGNIFLIDPSVVSRSVELAPKIISLRKRPLQLAGVLGWIFVCKFVLGLLTIDELEKRVSSLLKIQAVSIVTPYPEIGVDIDKPSDLGLANYLN